MKKAYVMQLYQRIYKSRKDPIFEPISDVFQIKWNDILYGPEKNLAELLLYESL